MESSLAPQKIQFSLAVFDIPFNFRTFCELTCNICQWEVWWQAVRCYPGTHIHSQYWWLSFAQLSFCLQSNIWAVTATGNHLYCLHRPGTSLQRHHELEIRRTPAYWSVKREDGERGEMKKKTRGGWWEGERKEARLPRFLSSHRTTRIFYESARGIVEYPAGASVGARGQKADLKDITGKYVTTWIEREENCTFQFLQTNKYTIYVVSAETKWSEFDTCQSRQGLSFPVSWR